MAKRLAFIDKKQEKFLKKVWPGRVTVVLERKEYLPSILFGKEKTIGLRIPKYKLINDLLRKINKPLTGTSANISGQEASTDLKKVLAQFRNRKYQPDLVIDAGKFPNRKPSIVIDVVSIPYKILRV